MGLLSAWRACWGLLGKLPKRKQQSTTTTTSQHLLSICLPLMDSDCLCSKGWTNLSSLLLKTPSPWGKIQGFPNQARHPLGLYTTIPPPYGCKRGWMAESPSLPEQRWQLGSHVSAQITASTMKPRTSEITTSPAEPLGVIQSHVVQPFTLPILSNAIQHFQTFGNFQPVSLFILVSNCCDCCCKSSSLPLTGSPNLLSRWQEHRWVSFPLQGDASFTCSLVILKLQSILTTPCLSAVHAPSPALLSSCTHGDLPTVVIYQRLNSKNTPGWY